MPSENTQTPMKRRTVVTSFINDVAPYFTVVGGSIVWHAGSGHPETQVTESNAFSQTLSRVSSRTPGFKSPNRAGLLLPNAFIFDLFKTSSFSTYTNKCFPKGVADGPGASVYIDQYSVSMNPILDYLGGEGTQSHIDRVSNKAVNNLLKNLRDSSFNAAQALAERKQTENLVASTATRVAKSLVSLRKGNFKKAAQDLGVIPKKRAGRRFNTQYATDQGKAIGNAWLELQYGWKPLLSDVYGSMETLAKANNPVNTQYVKRTGSSTFRTSSRQNTNLLPGGADGYYRKALSTSTVVSVRWGVTYAQTSPPLSTLASVGITNPALLAWELLPYSFVVDWFLPIGDYLSSLDATSGMTFHSGFKTIVTKVKQTHYEEHRYTRNSGYYLNYGYSQGEQETVHVERGKLSGFPSAPLPSFKNPLSSSHVASAMSLLLQLKR